MKYQVIEATVLQGSPGFGKQKTVYETDDIEEANKALRKYRDAQSLGLWYFIDTISAKEA